MSENTKEAPVLKGIASETQKKARQLRNKKKIISLWTEEEKAWDLMQRTPQL